MLQATYDRLESGTFVARIPSCKGVIKEVIAFASTLRECDRQLREILTLPIINNIDLNQEPM